MTRRPKIPIHKKGVPSQETEEELNIIHYLMNFFPNDPIKYGAITLDSISTKELVSFEDWKNTRITRNLNVMGGNTTITGTRLSVDTVGGRLMRGEREYHIRTDYPYLTDEDIKFSALYVRISSAVKEEVENAKFAITTRWLSLLIEAWNIWKHPQEGVLLDINLYPDENWCPYKYEWHRCVFRYHIGADQIPYLGYGERSLLESHFASNVKEKLYDPTFVLPRDLVIHKIDDEYKLFGK